MKKKILCVAFLVAVISCTSLFAKGKSGGTGFGAQFGWSPNHTGGALTFKVSSLPCVFAVDLGLGNHTYVGVNADWWIQNPKIVDTWGFFYGVGVGGGIDIYNNNLFGGCVGPRAVLGTNVFFIKGFLELYLQIAWHPLICFGASTDDAGLGFAWTNFPINLGFRFWF